jgi:hypothetical protein
MSSEQIQRWKSLRNEDNIKMSKELTKFTKLTKLDNLENVFGTKTALQDFNFGSVTVIRKKQYFIYKQLAIIFPDDLFFIFDIRIALI